MRIQSNYQISITQEEAWDALDDPNMVAKIIPNIKEFTLISENEYSVKITVSMGLVRGTFSGTTSIIEKKRPTSYSLFMKGQGISGSVQGRGDTTFSSNDTGGTNIDFSGEMRIAGVLGRIGQRFIQNSAISFMKQFFDNLAKEVQKRSQQ